MALKQSTLATELQSLAPTTTAGAAELRLAEAYGNYMHAAVANGVPIVAAAVDATAVPAMAAAMTFAAGATASQGAAVVSDGVSAFWAALVAAPATFFVGATVITQPPFATLVAALAAVFESNTSAERSLADAVAEVATVLHTATASQGTATFPGPVVAPIL